MLFPNILVPGWFVSDESIAALLASAEAFLAEADEMDHPAEWVLEITAYRDALRAAAQARGVPIMLVPGPDGQPGFRPAS